MIVVCVMAVESGGLLVMTVAPDSVENQYVDESDENLVSVLVTNTAVVVVAALAAVS